MLDSESIRRAQQGDHDAYEAIVRDYQETVFRLAYLMMGDADEAKDIAQEAFIRAYEQLHRFDLERPLRPWLLQITANLARNRKRALGRYLAALHRSVMPPDEESPHGQVWEHQALYEAVQRLDASEREIIYVRFFLGLSVQEAADILEIETGTVKSRLSRALKRLRGVILRDFPMLYEGRSP